MKRLDLRAALLMLTSFVSGGLVWAQLTEASGQIYVIDYMKAAPGAAQDYVDAELDWWKPVHVERIRRGTMRAWALYRVRYPDGVAREYDFVTVNVFDNFADSELDPVPLLAEVHSDKDADEIQARTAAARQLVRGELWYRIDHAE